VKRSLKGQIPINVPESSAKKEDGAGCSTFFRSLLLWDLASTDTTVPYLHNSFLHLDSPHHKVWNFLNW